MSHESFDSTETSVEVDRWDDDSIGGIQLFTEDKELTDCKLVVENDSNDMLWSDPDCTLISTGCTISNNNFHLISTLLTPFN